MNKYYLKRLMILAVPIMLSNVISQVQMIIDRIFLGQMDPLYMSALGNASSPMWTTMSFCFTIVMGSSILISQNVGAGNDENIEKYAASMIKWNNVVPFCLFIFWLVGGKLVFKLMGVSDNVMPLCLGYMRWFAPSFLLIGFESSFSVIMQTSNYTKPMIFYGIIRSGTNVVLDWLLIFGHFGLPALGIEGAAIATTIAEFAGCIFATVICLSKPLRTMPKFIKVIKAPVVPFLHSIRLGINAALEDFAWNIGNIAIMRILNTIDEMAAGIYSIVLSVELLAVVVIGSIGNGTLTLSGEAKGKGDVKQFKGVAFISYLLCAGLAAFVLVICIIFPHQILRLFSKDEAIIMGSGIYLALVCLNLFGKSGNIIIGSAIRGTGNTIWMFMTQILGTVMVIGFACLFVYVFDMKMVGVFVAVILDELIRAVINLFKLINITRNWETK